MKDFKLTIQTRGRIRWESINSPGCLSWSYVTNTSTYFKVSQKLVFFNTSTLCCKPVRCSSCCAVLWPGSAKDSLNLMAVKHHKKLGWGHEKAVQVSGMNKKQPGEHFVSNYVCWQQFSKKTGLKKEQLGEAESGSGTRPWFIVCKHSTLCRQQLQLKALSSQNET